MEKYCPYCQSELDYLNVVKERALEWNGDAWVDDPKAVAVIQCPECGDELEATDLGILGIPNEVIKKATADGKVDADEEIHECEVCGHKGTDVEWQKTYRPGYYCKDSWSCFLRYREERSAFNEC